MVKNLKQYTLLIAEDEPDTLKENTLYFGHYFRFVFQAKDGEQALEVFKQKKPDVVILDISMPYVNGLEIAKKIKCIAPNTQIIILSAHNDTHIFLKAIEINLLSYIIKPLNRKNAKELIIKLSNKFKQIAPNKININQHINYDIKNKSVIINNNSILLSKNEVLLLEYMLNNKNNILSVENIATTIYFDINELSNFKSCVKTIISTLKRKIPDLPIKNKYGLGYVLRIND